MRTKTTARIRLRFCRGALLCALFPAQSKAQLPVRCKASSALSAPLHASPSAKVYDAAGAWFAQHNDLTCALAAFENAVRIEPDSAEAHYNLGLAHLGLHHEAEAERNLHLALRDDPHLHSAHTALGMLLLDAGRPAEAETEFRQVVADEKPSVDDFDHVGLALSAQGRYGAALQVWKEALALDPDSREILLSIGVATYKNGDVEGAIALLKRLTVSRPNDKDAQLALGNVLASALLYGEAAAHYAEVLRLAPDDNASLLLYAKALSNAGSYDAALVPAGDYVRRRPDDPEGRLILGSVERRLTNYNNADEQLALAVKDRPADAQAQYELGMSLFRGDRFSEALPHLEDAFALNPSDAPTDFALAAVLRRLGNVTRANEVTETMKNSKEKERNITLQAVDGSKANAFLQAGQPAKAIEIYRRMLMLDPGNARTEYNLALALGAMHDLKGEREALESAVRHDRKMAVAESELGLMDLATGETSTAEKELNAALGMNPQYAPAKGNLGLIYALRHENTAAEKMFRQSVEDDPAYLQGYLNLGLMLAARDDFHGSEIQLEHALALAPVDARVLSALGKVKTRLGKSDEAIALFRKNATSFPNNAEFHIELAIVLADSYDLAGALREADRAVELAPGSASAQFNRGRILFDLGHTSEARQSLKTASELAHTQLDPVYYLALIEKQEGHLAAAGNLLQIIVKAQPANVTALYFLGQCLQADRSPEAIAAWRRAAELSPEYTPALWSLSQALKTVDAAEAARYSAQLQAALAKGHALDEAQLTANNAIALMEAHDWSAALKSMQTAVQLCGECAAKASLHKSLGLAYCHAGELDNGKKELEYAESLKGGDPDIQRALLLIARTRASHTE